MSNKTSFDTVIIGNGSLGLGLAYQLAKRDPERKVALVGPSSRTGGATVTAGAMINVWAEMSFGQFENAPMADRASVTIQAMDLWDGLCQELSDFGTEPLGVSWGTLVINNAMGSPHEVRAVDYIIAAMKARGVEYELLAPEAISWLKPEQRGQISRVVKVPDGRIDPRRVLAAYEKAISIKGVQVFDSRAVKLRVSKGLGGFFNGGTKTVTLSDGTNLEAPQVVLANGSFAQDLIDQVPELREQTPRLLWGAGSALDVSLPPWVHKYGGIDRSIFDIDSVVRTVDRGGACGLHLVPYGNGEYYVGASSGVWFEPEDKPRVHALHVLLRGLVEEINKAFFFSTVAIRGPGFRPVCIDTYPLLGESEMKGIWFANGTKRDGFTCSPLITTQLADALQGKRNSLPRRFLPSRKLISYKNKEQAIEDSVAGDFGGEVQHGLNLPPYAIQDYRNLKRAKIEAVYEKRGIADFGIHPEVVHLYENDDFFRAINHPREVVV
jgi:glycine/D-amino acid oxidase-like deaminating enzyme